MGVPGWEAKAKEIVENLSTHRPAELFADSGVSVTIASARIRIFR